MRDLQLMFWVAVALGVLIGVYVIVRVGAIAWFRTRREHAHRLMREMMNDGRRDDG